MTNARGSTTIVALLATAGLLLGGCGGDDEPTTPAPAAPAATTAVAEVDPKAALADSTAELKKGNYQYLVTGDGATEKGEVHLPESVMVSRSAPKEQPTQLDLMVVGKEHYLKMQADLGAGAPTDGPIVEMFSGKKWLHIDPAKLDENIFEGSAEPDLTDAAKMLASATTAERKGDAISGTLDVSKMKADDLPWEEEEVKELGDKLKSLPYSATLDPQGRLTKLSVDMPAVGKEKAYTYVAEYSGFGAAQVQSKPAAAEAIEPTAEMYKIFNEG